MRGICLCVYLLSQTVNYALKVLNGVDAAFLSADRKVLLKKKILQKFTDVESQYKIGSSDS